MTVKMEGRPLSVLEGGQAGRWHKIKLSCGRCGDPVHQEKKAEAFGITDLACRSCGHRCTAYPLRVLGMLAGQARNGGNVLRLEAAYPERGEDE